MEVKEEIKKTVVTEPIKIIIQSVLPLVAMLVLGRIPLIRDQIWPAIPKWLLLVTAVISLSANLVLLPLVLRSRRKLKEVQSTYENPEEVEPNEKDKEILRYLFQSNVVRTLGIIIERLNFEHAEEARYHLNMLIKHGYIRPLKRPLPGRFPEYRLTDKGREYILKNKLI